MQRTKSKEKPTKDQKNNNASTYKKCPEMTQSMLDEEKLKKSLEPDTDYFSKTADFFGFQEQNSKGFSSVIGNTRHLKERKGPEYRRINRYYKSIGQYWKERTRRKKAWELSGKGLTYKQIAEKLGISEKTVQRDLKKTRPYYHRLYRKYSRELEQQRIDNLNVELEGKTLSQRLKILSREIANQMQLMKQREYNRHMLKIIIDMDDLTEGFPAIRFWPKPPISLGRMPYHFQFHVQRNGEQFYLGEIKLG